MGVVLLWSGEKISQTCESIESTLTFLFSWRLLHFQSWNGCVIMVEEELVFCWKKKLGSASFYFFWVQQPEESPNLPAEEMSSSANKKSAKWRHLNISTSNFHLKNKKPTNLLLHLSQQEIFFHSKSSTEKSESHLPAPPYLSCYFSINKAKTWCTDSKIPSHRE